MPAALQQGSLGFDLGFLFFLNLIEHLLFLFNYKPWLSLALCTQPKARDATVKITEIQQSQKINYITKTCFL
jgi:hypothetical protein